MGGFYTHFHTIGQAARGEERRQGEEWRQDGGKWGASMWRQEGDRRRGTAAEAAGGRGYGHVYRLRGASGSIMTNVSRISQVADHDDASLATVSRILRIDDHECGIVDECIAEPALCGKVI